MMRPDRFANEIFTLPSFWFELTQPILKTTQTVVK
jgi:hypothetical protein